MRNLQAESLRREVFEDIYFPALSEADKKKSQDVLYAKFGKAFTIVQTGKESPDQFALKVQSESPAQAVDWARTFVSKAGAAAEKEMIQNVTREAEVRARNLNQQIETLREAGQKVREDLVVKLREALRIANAVGLEKPPLINGNLSTEVSASMDGELTYMRGSKALLAEIENLEQRKSDDPFIRNLRALQIRYSFYKNLSVSPSAVSVYRLDGPIEQPDSPVQPRKGLILAAGIVLGGGFGVLIALARSFSRRSRNSGGDSK
ncbi:ECA polysaccharide chain length modulation protein [compost metagenome]